MRVGESCPDTELWEPWPYADNPDDPTGGIEEPAVDSYLRIGLRLGYEFTGL
jgi:hypothetical protein